ncbi:MAG: helix-turn-helix domain-containing protein [Muribaculaceae bacterium]|nr:helix-turn-helix domain-containing protein [Muribaculaceae bacterium]
MNESDTITIGQRIRQFRKDKGLSQTELANKISKSLRTVQKYEKGEIEVAISVISDIAAALDIPSSEILGYQSGVESIQRLSDIMDFLFKLENIKNVDFRIDIKKPPHCEQWECSISFNGKQGAEYNPDLCLFLERWAEERENFRTYFSSLESYSMWKAETLAYYAQSELESEEPPALDFETLLKKRKEYLEAELKKKKDG